MNRRLQIGMWNGLDPAHWEAYATERITGLEISQFRSLEQLEELAAFAAERKLAYGIHTPVLRGDGYSLPAITALEEERREAGFARLEEEAGIASRFGADYLLLHFPYPSIFPNERDEAYLRRLPSFEHYEMSDWKDLPFEAYAETAFKRIRDIQERTRQRIVLEYDFFGDFDLKFLQAMFGRYPELGLVMDLQRLDVHRRVFPAFDPYAYVEALAPYVYLVHYSNARYTETGMDRHLPVLPEHAGLPDYGDAPQYLAALSRLNRQFHVTFEHNPAKVTKQQLELCYEFAAATLSSEEAKMIDGS